MLEDIYKSIICEKEMIGCANVQKMSEKHYGLCVECVTLPVIQPCNTRVTPEYKTENFIFFSSYNSPIFSMFKIEHLEP